MKAASRCPEQPPYTDGFSLLHHVWTLFLKPHCPTHTVHKSTVFFSPLLFHSLFSLSALTETPPPSCCCIYCIYWSYSSVWWWRCFLYEHTELISWLLSELKYFIYCLKNIIKLMFYTFILYILYWRCFFSDSYGCSDMFKKSSPNIVSYLFTSENFQTEEVWTHMNRETTGGKISYVYVILNFWNSSIFLSYL